MNQLIKVLLVGIVMSSTVLIASGNHSHNNGHSHHAVSKEVIIKKANQKLLTLVKNKKLPKSWLKSSILAMKKKQFNQHKEWVISYENSKITNVKKRVLYIFVNLHAKVTGANYTGN